MPVRLGISPIGWSNDDLPELGGDTPLETCLAEARLAGFEGIELGNKFPRDPAVLRPILERQGLALISGWYSGRLLNRSLEEELAAIEAHRALLVAMGCAVLVYAGTSGEIDRLMGATGDSVGLLLDTGHLAFAGVDPAALARRHGCRISHVHCKDVRGDVLAWVQAADVSFLDAVVAGVFTVPGDGSIDFSAVLEALAAAEYHGWLVV